MTNTLAKKTSMWFNSKRDSNRNPTHGGIAQLGECLTGSQKVVGSSPIVSIIHTAKLIHRTCSSLYKLFLLEVFTTFMTANQSSPFDCCSSFSKAACMDEGGIAISFSDSVDSKLQFFLHKCRFRRFEKIKL